MTTALTFVVPAFNAATTLGDTLRSILAQTRRDWLTLVIDDGSTDATAEVASSFHDPRIRVVHQQNSGVAHARNRGLAMSSSPAVCFIDSDDCIDPAFAETMLPALADKDLVPSAYRYTGPDLEDANWTVVPAADDPSRLVDFNQYAIGAIVFRRDVLTCHELTGRQLPQSSDHHGPGPVVGASHPFPLNSRHEDWELLLNLRNARWAPPVTTPLYSYRLRPGSRTTALAEIWRDGLNLIARSHADQAAQSSLALRRWTVRNLARAATMVTPSLCRRLFEHLDALTAFDLDTLAGALRWSMRRATVSRESPALQPRDAWHAQILMCLDNQDIARDAIRRAATPDWSVVAAAAAARLAPNQTLVIYGAGRNGRDVLNALRSAKLPLAVIDDGPDSLPEFPRLTVSDLSPRHIVLVTPDDRAAILATLSRARPAQVLLPEQLVA